MNPHITDALEPRYGVPRPRGDEPLALAVEMAEEFGMTLIGFVKADMFKFAVGRIGSG